jgi:hypothetical protein
VGADFATICLEAHTTALDEIGHCGHGFAIVPARAAHSQDQIPEAVVGSVQFLVVLFHFGDSMLFLRLRS